MVDDHHVGGGGALPHPGDEAFVVLRALGAETGVGGRRDLVPEGEVLRQILELGAVAGFGALRPLADDRQKDVVRGERVLGALRQPIELVQAEVVGAPLHVGGGERDAERVAQRRDVLEVNLFLEVLGAGGDEHPFAAEDRRDEIGERLSGAGARLREEDSAVGEHLRHGRGHLDLSGTGLEVGHGAGQRAARRKDRFDYSG
jgi:hypothetical protein